MGTASREARWIGEHTQEAQATALVRIFVLAMATRQLSLIAWYRINDLEPAQEVIGHDNNRHLGIRRPPDQVKPAAQAFVELRRLFAQPFRILNVPVTIVERQGSEPEVRAFQLQDGRYVVAAWMGNGSTRGSSVAGQPIDDQRRAVVRVDLRVESEGMELMDGLGRRLDKSRVTEKPGNRDRQLHFELRGGELLLLVGRPASRGRPGITARTPPHGGVTQMW